MKLIQKTTVLAKKETAYGVVAMPQPSDALLVSEMRITPLSAEMVDRNLVSGHLGAQRQFRAKERVEIAFRLELTGAGSAGTAPVWATLLRACGWREVLTTKEKAEYTPVDGSSDSVSIKYVVDGTIHLAKGCRGSASVDFTVGQIPTITFHFSGLIESISEGNNPGAQNKTWPLPVLPSTEVTPNVELAEHQVRLSKLQIDLGAKVEFVNFIGHQEMQIIDRRITGEMILQAPVLGDKDFFADVRDQSLHGLTLEHGNEEGHRIKFAAPKVQLSDLRYVDLDGIVVLEAGLRFTPSVAQDELKITVY